VTGQPTVLMHTRPTVSIEEARARVGVSRRTIYNWMHAGKLEYVRTAGGGIRIFTDTLWRDATGRPLERAYDLAADVVPSGKPSGR
jgi:excisionase family DNA binding protein